MKNSKTLRKKLALFVVLSMVLVFFAGIQPASAATTYNVGPGQAYANIGDVPWESLNAGDTVNIYYRATPYKEKWAIGRQGTASAPITVRGIPGPNGELPVIDGNGATTRLALDYPSETRGLITIQSTNIPASTQPQYIIIENLEICGAKSPNKFYDDNGVLQTYNANAAGIWVEKGDNITVRNCIIRDNGNGFFTFYGDSYGCASRDILVEGCNIYNNGNSGSLYEHNNYTESLRITFQYNRFGPLTAGAVGNNLKDRSAGLVVRYNWLEGGNKQLDLVDAEDSVTLQRDPSYNTAYVYGNIIIENPGDGNYQMVNFGGDSAKAPDKTGPLYFYNNTVISKRTDRAAVIRLATNSSSADVRNNIMYAPNGPIYLLEQYGNVTLSHNWFSAGWQQRVATKQVGVITDDGTQIVGTSPGFVNEANADYRLAAGSPCINTGGALNSAVLPANNLTRQYVKHNSSSARTMNGTAWDIGAFEY